METKAAPSGWAKIYIAGPLAVAEQVCREECMREGLCVTIEPTKFIYTGGEETGCVIGFVNYPRFPSDQAAITKRASDLALLLIERLCQTSAMVMDPQQTVWFSRRSEA